MLYSAIPFLFIKHKKMIKRNLFIGAIVLLLSTKISAQSLMHSLGTTSSVIFGRINTPSTSYSFSLRQANVSYFPRYSLTESDNSSITIGAPVGIGVGLITNTYSSEVKPYFSFELPVVIDYNIGLKSTPDNDRRSGFYVGAGFSYYNISLGSNVATGFDGKTYGPLGRLGMRFDITGNGSSKKAVAVGLFYKAGLETTKLSTIGINLFVDF